MWNLLACAFAVFVGCLVTDPVFKSLNLAMAVWNFGLAMKSFSK